MVLLIITMSTKTAVDPVNCIGYMGVRTVDSLISHGLRELVSAFWRVFRSKMPDWCRNCCPLIRGVLRLDRHLDENAGLGQKRLYK